MFMRSILFRTICYKSYAWLSVYMSCAICLRCAKRLGIWILNAFWLGHFWIPLCDDRVHKRVNVCRCSQGHHVDIKGCERPQFGLCVQWCCLLLRFLSHFTWLSYLALSEWKTRMTPTCKRSPKILHGRWATGSDSGQTWTEFLGCNPPLPCYLCVGITLRVNNTRVSGRLYLYG